MEKKTILALVLSFLVFIGWSLFFGPEEKHAPEKEAPLEKEIAQTLPEAPKTTDSASPAPSRPLQKIAARAMPDVDEREIEVDTPLYRAVFSNAGPTIKSFRLKKYHETIEPHSPLIELVNLEKDMGDFLLIRFEDAAAPQSKNLIFKADHQEIRLGPESSPKDLVFRSTTSNGLLINKTFRFHPDKYNIDVIVSVDNQSEHHVNGRFTIGLKALPPQKKTGYYSYVGLVLLIDDELEEFKIKKSSDEKAINGQVEWIAYEDDFFISAVVPKKKERGAFKGHLFPSGLLEGTFVPASTSLSPFQEASSNYTLYFGPRELSAMKQVGENLAKAINFGWTDILAKPLLYLLRFFNDYIKNYVVSIILLTILIKILFWPLTHKSYKSMKEMQKLQPRMAKIREKHKGNKEQLNKEMMALYKTYKVNPMGGCLPMIIQIPVFFALFRILGSAIELRHAPFMLWIHDLSAPDRLFNFPFHIPFMAPPYGIPVLTLLMGASMFIQQKMTPSPGDPTQAKVMMFLPLIFTFMFINFPSGLVLYWLVNNILSIGQQYRIHRRPE